MILSNKSLWGAEEGSDRWLDIQVYRLALRHTFHSRGADEKLL
jgi:hypothetical protein